MADKQDNHNTEAQDHAAGADDVSPMTISQPSLDASNQAGMQRKQSGSAETDIVNKRGSASVSSNGLQSSGSQSTPGPNSGESPTFGTSQQSTTLQSSSTAPVYRQPTLFGQSIAYGRPPPANQKATVSGAETTSEKPVSAEPKLQRPVSEQPMAERPTRERPTPARPVSEQPAPGQAASQKLSRHQAKVNQLRPELYELYMKHKNTPVSGPRPIRKKPRDKKAVSVLGSEVQSTAAAPEADATSMIDATPVIEGPAVVNDPPVAEGPPAVDTVANTAPVVDDQTVAHASSAVETTPVVHAADKGTTATNNSKKVFVKGFDPAGWYDNPLPGPKPEWGYTHPKVIPKMSRAYRANDAQDFNALEKTVFVSQDDAPYSALSYSHSVDRESFARLIMRHTKSREVRVARPKEYVSGLETQSEDEKDESDEDEARVTIPQPQQPDHAENVAPVSRQSSRQSSRPSVRQSIAGMAEKIPKTPKQVSEKTSIDEATANWWFNSFSALSETVGKYSRDLYQQMTTLLGHLYHIIKTILLAIKNSLTWLIEGINAKKWWLLGSGLLFLFVFGMTNDWFSSLGFYRYNIPSAHTTSVTSTGPPVTSTLLWLPKTHLVRPGIPVFQPETIKIHLDNSQIDTPVAQPGTSKTHRVTTPPTRPGTNATQRATTPLSARASSYVTRTIRIMKDSVSSVNVPSSISNIHSRISPSASTVAIGQGINRLFQWLEVLMSLWTSPEIPLLSRVTDLRVIIALLSVGAAIWIYRRFSEKIRGSAWKVLAWIGSISAFIVQTMGIFARKVRTRIIGDYWPPLRSKIVGSKEAVYKGCRIVREGFWSSLIKLQEFVFNIPFLIIWHFTNPWTATKSTVTYSFTYVTGGLAKIARFLLVLVSWPTYQFLAAVNWAIETIKCSVTALGSWLKSTFETLKIRVVSWAELGKGWPSAWKVLVIVGKLFGWVSMLMLWTAFIFAAGLGFRDLYDGFEKIVVEVLPC